MSTLLGLLTSSVGIVPEPSRWYERFLFWISQALFQASEAKQALELAAAAVLNWPVSRPGTP